jgi:hypothetical protein
VNTVYLSPGSRAEPEGGSCACMECDGSKEIDGETCLHCAGAGRIDEDGNPVSQQLEFQGE